MSRSLKNTSERSFTIENAYHVDGCPTKFFHKDYTGRYQCKTPAQAASKAMTNLCTLKGVHGQCTFYIEMRETTQGSNHKIFSYHVNRVKYSTAIDAPGGARQYHNVVHKAKAPTEKCKGSHKSSGPMRSKRHSVRRLSAHKHTMKH
uniref:Uncharacterized protein n=1 Tax=viral metagenome TaxID=1070528 RepID=A0A6C0HLP9_9ZZZZ